MSYVLINDYQLVEGFTAMLLLPFFTYMLKDLHLKNRFIQSVLVISFGWLFTWFGRKISVSVYTHYKKKYRWNGYTIKSNWRV